MPLQDPVANPEKFDKFRELVVYIAKRGENDPRLGAVKLNKILYFADFYAYRVLGESISGAVYQHLPEGPAPRDFLTVRQSLLKDEAIRLEEVPYFNRVQIRIVAEREVKVGVLSDEELRLVDEVMAELAHMTATEVTRLSHDEPGWKHTKEGETIPYKTAWISPESLTQEDIEYGKQLAERHALVEA